MNKKAVVILTAVIVTAAGLAVFWKLYGRPLAAADQKIVMAAYGDIERAVSATGNVQPQNRLEIKPPIAGRIDKVLVEEGQMVKAGDILALLSSTERATLIDAARQQGPDQQKEWEEVVKPTSLISPVDAEVIVKSVNPGQTVTPSDPVVVLSDRLIVQAQVDETDIGKVKLGQSADISLDAYPDIHVKGTIDHIYYESKLVNNVTMYAVDIVPDKVPGVFRSGMSANVQIIQDRHTHVLLLPKEAVKAKNSRSFVMLKVEGEKKPQRQGIETGVSDDNNIEVTAGLKEGDKVVIMTMARNPANKKPSSSSPFMPAGGGGRGGR